MYKTNDAFELYIFKSSIKKTGYLKKKTECLTIIQNSVF